MLNGNFVE